MLDGNFSLSVVIAGHSLPRSRPVSGLGDLTMGTEPSVVTDVLRRQAYRAAMAAWADRMGRAPVEIPEQWRRSGPRPTDRVPR
jgi:hypothetical protein